MVGKALAMFGRILESALTALFLSLVEQLVEKLFAPAAA